MRRVSPGTQASRPPLPGTRRSVVVSRDSRPLFEERGWLRRSGMLVGRFHTPRGSFCGRIEDPWSKDPRYFVLNPPTAVLSGPHGPCFRPSGPGLYAVHWNHRPRTLDAGIAAIERLITESLT